MDASSGREGMEWRLAEAMAEGRKAVRHRNLSFGVSAQRTVSVYARGGGHRVPIRVIEFQEMCPRCGTASVPRLRLGSLAVCCLPACQDFQGMEVLSRLRNTQEYLQGYLQDR